MGGTLYFLIPFSAWKGTELRTRIPQIFPDLIAFWLCTIWGLAHGVDWDSCCLMEFGVPLINTRAHSLCGGGNPREKKGRESSVSY